MAAKKSKRPLGITIISILIGLGATVLIIVGILALGAFSLDGTANPGLSALLPFLGLFTIILGILFWLSGFWMYRLEKRGYLLYIILWIAGTVFTIIDWVFITRTVPRVENIAIPIIILWYLYSRRTVFK